MKDNEVEFTNAKQTRCDRNMSELSEPYVWPLLVSKWETTFFSNGQVLISLN